MVSGAVPGGVAPNTTRTPPSARTKTGMGDGPAGGVTMSMAAQHCRAQADRQARGAPALPENEAGLPV
jgi:hypothetical protein